MKKDSASDRSPWDLRSFPPFIPVYPKDRGFFPSLKRGNPGTDFALVSHESVFNFNKLKLLKAVARNLLPPIKGEGTH
jgi:hypothetical protein